MQQIYRRTPCREAISINLLCNFIEVTLRHGCSPVNLLHIFRTPFLKNTSGWLLLTEPSKMISTGNHQQGRYLNAMLIYCCFDVCTGELFYGEILSWYKFSFFNIFLILRSRNQISCHSLMIVHKNCIMVIAIIMFLSSLCTALLRRH